MGNTVKEKQVTINKLLDEEYVLVHLNPKTSGLVVPDYLLHDPSVTLKLSRYFRGELDVQEDEIVAELLFSGSYSTCKIPYTAIWGCTSQKGKNIIWPESTPDDVLKSILDTAQSEPPQVVKKFQSVSEKKKQGHLRRVK